MSGAQRAARRIGLEAGLITLALVAAAWMIRSLPIIPAARVAAWTITAGETQLACELWPARQGVNRLTCAALDAGGEAEIEVTFLPVGGGGVASRRTLVWSEGVYATGGLALGRPGQPLAYASADWAVGPDGGVWLAAEPRPLEAEILGWVNRAGALSLSLLAAAGTLGWGYRAWRRWRLVKQAIWNA